MNLKPFFWFRLQPRCSHTNFKYVLNMKPEYFNYLSQARSSWVTHLAFWILFLVVAYFDLCILISLSIIYLVSIGFGLLERLFLNKRIPPSNAAVFITGTSAGIGKSLTQRLANSGITVFAGVRKEADGEALKSGTRKPENIIPVIVDVVKEDQVKSAAKFVDEALEKKNLRLLAVVNNAGFGEMGPIEGIKAENFRRQFDVNVFGLVTVTQEFIPVLRSKGMKSGPHPSRIINISSGAGIISVPPGGCYSASKYAVEAISEALRAELKPWNIRVSLVEPGRFHTEFQDKAYVLPELRDELDESVRKHYNILLQQTNEESAKRKRPSAELCVDVIVDSIYDTSPQPRYLAGQDVQFGLPIITALPFELKDFALAKKWLTLHQ